MTQKITPCHTRSLSHSLLGGALLVPTPFPAGPPQARPCPLALALSQALLTSQRRWLWKHAQRPETGDVASQNPLRGGAGRGLRRAGHRAPLGKLQLQEPALTTQLFLPTTRTTSPRTLCASASLRKEQHFPEGPETRLDIAPALQVTEAAGAGTRNAVCDPGRSWALRWLWATVCEGVVKLCTSVTVIECSSGAVCVCVTVAAHFCACSLRGDGFCRCSELLYFQSRPWVWVVVWQIVGLSRQEWESDCGCVKNCGWLWAWRFCNCVLIPEIAGVYP